MNKVTLLTDTEGNDICALKEGFTKDNITEALKDEYSITKTEFDEDFDVANHTFNVTMWDGEEESNRELYLTELYLY